MTINAATLEVDSGSSISADGQGYLGSGCNGAGSGPGGGPFNCNNDGNGGSYGGVGGGPNQSSMITYGSGSAPRILALAAAADMDRPWAAPGGAIHLVVSASLTNNGVISSNEQELNCSGAGSGGSVYVTTATLTGSGSFVANGGAAPTCSTGRRARQNCGLLHQLHRFFWIHSEHGKRRRPRGKKFRDLCQ